MPPVKQSKQAETVFYVGGCRSGKSRLAEDFVAGAYSRPCYVATMTPSSDGELQERIALHRQRRGDQWQLIEEPRALAPLLTGPLAADVLLIDCLTMWLTNLLLAGLSDQAVRQEGDALVEAIHHCPRSVVLVANEVGLGIVPESDLGRRFRDLAGWLNQQVAAACRRVVLVTAGLPLLLKDE